MNSNLKFNKIHQNPGSEVLIEFLKLATIVKYLSPLMMEIPLLKVQHGYL